jgi:hypothetical protein
MLNNSNANKISPELLTLAQRMDNVAPGQVRKRGILNACGIGIAATLGTLVVWAILSGRVTTDIEKKFAVLLAGSALSLLIVATLSFCSLFMSFLTYHRLSLLKEKLEVEEAARETADLIEAFEGAIQSIPQKEQRERKYL